LIPLNTLSHSVNIAGQQRVLRAYWKRVGKLSGPVIPAYH
jgi:hypothetical protein